MFSKSIYLLILIIPISAFSQNTFPATGNVGAGTNSPNYNLELFGDEPILSITQNPGIAGAGGIRILGAGTGPKAFIQFHSGGAIWSQSGGIGSNRLEFGNAERATTYMTLLNGNLGIGNTNPSSRLTLSGNFEFTPNSGSYINFGMDQRSQFITGKTGAYLYSGSGPGGIIPAGTLVLQSRSNLDRDIVFVSGANPTDRMRIKGDGDVIINTQLSIGTDTNIGTHKLAVVGSIGAREVKVLASGWSDFVFEQDYVLPTLAEVQQHIRSYGHLKDIPSASEVEKDGIFLGEMDAKLLQKIEELTLYLIQENQGIVNSKT